jgi:hypothetical protein
MLSNPESQANVLLGVQIGRYSPAGHLGGTLFRPEIPPSRHATCVRRAVSPVASARRWLLVLLSPLLSVPLPMLGIWPACLYAIANPSWPSRTSRRCRCRPVRAVARLPCRSVSVRTGRGAVGAHSGWVREGPAHRNSRAFHPDGRPGHADRPVRIGGGTGHSHVPGTDALLQEIAARYLPRIRSGPTSSSPKNCASMSRSTCVRSDG